MFNFFSTCGFCSKVPVSGDQAYEVFEPYHSNNIYGNNNLTIKGQQSHRDKISTGQQFQGKVPVQSVVAGDYTYRDLKQKITEQKIVRKILKSSYCESMRELQKKKTIFVDSQFPPTQLSIGKMQDVPLHASWKRITEVVDRPIFMSEDTNPNDLYQVKNYNSVFQSGLAVLCQKKRILRSIFQSLEMSSYGIYMARITFRGVLREVVVDDYVPVNLQGEPLFSKPSDGNQIWNVIIQKCWAKLNGSYASIVGNQMSQILNALSGAPTRSYQISKSTQKRQDLWNKLLQMSQMGGLITGCSKNEPQIQKIGLARNQYYTILSIYNSPYRIVKLRNSKLDRVWIGRASYGDRRFWSMLSPADRQRLGFSNENNGVFYVLWEDFVNLFNFLNICLINQNASTTFIQTQFSKKRAQLFQFQSSGGRVIVSISQPSLKGRGQAIQKKGYSRSSLIISKFDPKQKQGFQYKYISSSTNRTAQHNLILNKLQPGKYIVYAKIQWIDTHQGIGSVNLYCQNQTHLVHTKQRNHKSLLFKTFLDHARRSNKKQALGPLQWICTDMLLDECGYGYLVLHIDEKSQRTLGVQLNESGYTEKRIVLKKPYRGKGIIKGKVQPGKQFIVLFRIKSQNYPSVVNLPQPKIYNVL